MISLAKGLLGFTLIGLGGGTAVYSSLIFKPDHFTNWRNKELNQTGPILTCGDSLYDVYKVLLKTAEDGKNDMGVGATIEFEVLSKGSSGSSERTWIRGWGKTIVYVNDWLEWMFFFDGKGDLDNIRFKDKDFGNKPGGFTTDYMVNPCKDSMIELKEHFKGSEQEERIMNKDIKFWVDESRCKKEENSVTCDLLFSPDSKLKWKEQFQPQITFSR